MPLQQLFVHSVGLALGGANAVRHRVAGYRTPRPFANDDVERAAQHDAKVVARWASHVDFSGCRVLELGPGPDLGTGAIVLSRGATSYTAVDIFPLAEGVTPEFYARLGEKFGVQVDPTALRYELTDFPAMSNIDGPFDVVVSNATLEHFADVQGTFLRLGELAAPGCIMCHHIDAKTHMRWIKDQDPLNLLRYSEATYRAMSFPGVPNRLRAGDFAEAAEVAGFDAAVVPGRQAPPGYVEKVRPHLATRFRDRGDLNLLSFTLVARFPGNG